MQILGYGLIDIDNHYYEVDDCCSRHIERKYRDLAYRPLPIPDVQEFRQWGIGERYISSLPIMFNPAEFIAPPGTLVDFLAGKGPPVMTELIRPRDHLDMVQRDARVKRMDEQGLQAAVLLPSLGLFIECDFADRVDLVCANLRAFNRWLEDDWGYGADGRLYAVPQLTLLDLDWAIAELERVASLGARAIYLKTGPVKGRSPADPCFDPFWARVQECGLKVIYHLGDTTFRQLYGVHWSEDPGRNYLQFSPMQRYLADIIRPITDTLAALLLHNLFGRFPGIKILTVELGSMWVRPLLAQLDKAAKTGNADFALGGPLEERPSEVFRRHVYVTPFFEDDILDLVDAIGVEHVLFGSDYPHAEGFEKPSDFAKELDGLSADQVRRIMRDNAAEILQIGA